MVQRRRRRRRQQLAADSSQQLNRERPSWLCTALLGEPKPRRTCVVARKRIRLASSNGRTSCFLVCADWQLTRLASTTHYVWRQHTHTDCARPLAQMDLPVFVCGAIRLDHDEPVFAGLRSAKAAAAFTRTVPSNNNNNNDCTNSIPKSSLCCFCLLAEAEAAAAAPNWAA